MSPLPPSVLKLVLIRTPFLAALCTLVAMFRSRSALRDVDLPGNLRFMWFMLWLIPIQVYLAISMFDYHNVTDVYVVHWWNARAMAWYRSMVSRYCLLRF